MAEETDFSSLSFEDALKRLEAIVQQLESGDVPLDQSITLYAEGDLLRQQCQKRLQDAQARIDKIALGSDGSVAGRSEEHTSELQSLMRISYAVFCLKKKK